MTAKKTTSTAGKTAAKKPVSSRTAADEKKLLEMREKHEMLDLRASILEARVRIAESQKKLASLNALANLNKR